MKGTKTWVDNNNQDGKRPKSITIRLLVDGKEVQNKEVKESDNWSWSFENLPVYENGKKLEYTITEDAVADYTTNIDGYNVTSYEPKELREKIGIVLQKAVLFKGTIRENILWGNSSATDKDIYKALEDAQALDIIKQKENGLDEIIEQNGRNLSGGQRQRISIARALIKKPDILILDDSSSALDYLTDYNLRTALKNLDYKPTIIMVSQRTSSIEHADKIVVLDEGEMVGFDIHDNLLKNCKVYKEIYNSQFKGGSLDE